MGENLDSEQRYFEEQNLKTAQTVQAIGRLSLAGAAGSVAYGIHEFATHEKIMALWYSERYASFAIFLAGVYGGLKVLREQLINPEA